MAKIDKAFIKEIARQLNMVNTDYKVNDRFIVDGNTYSIKVMIKNTDSDSS